MLGCLGHDMTISLISPQHQLAPWWMTVVCVGLASFGASSRVSGGTGPATGGAGSCFEPVGA